MFFLDYASTSKYEGEFGPFKGVTAVNYTVLNKFSEEPQALVTMASRKTLADRYSRYIRAKAFQIQTCVPASFRAIDRKLGEGQVEAQRNLDLYGEEFSFDGSHTQKPFYVRAYQYKAKIRDEFEKKGSSFGSYSKGQKTKFAHRIRIEQSSLVRFDVKTISLSPLITVL